MKYSAENKLAADVCKKLGIIYEIRFVEAGRQKGKIFVRGTAGKPDEFALLAYRAGLAGYVYTGKIARENYNCGLSTAPRGQKEKGK